MTRIILGTIASLAVVTFSTVVLILSASFFIYPMTAEEGVKYFVVVWIFNGSLLLFQFIDGHQKALEEIDIRFREQGKVLADLRESVKKLEQRKEKTS
ncbi:MAG: hypothetical protein WCV68_03160 [Candidatus Paceibacterota bacterium]|jgi:hypothetical protein